MTRPRRSPDRGAPGRHPGTPQTELHRHLDVALRLPTLLELAQRAGLEGRSTSLEVFRRKLVIAEPLADLADVLARFRLFQQVLRHPADCERVAYEAIFDCYIEGTHQVELRFSPSFVCELSGLAWFDALTGFHRGMERALAELPGMRGGLICIASRDYGPDSAAETADFYLAHRELFVGFDLAGNEAGFPCRLFEQAIAPIRVARKADPAHLHITIHAGEAAGPSSVWEALELLGAERIGHGVRAFEDPLLVERLARDRICLEMCPTSNWLTRAVPTLADHPLRRALAAGVPASINTDDPTIMGVTLPGELRVAHERIGLTHAELHRCLLDAAAATFLP